MGHKKNSKWFGHKVAVLSVSRLFSSRTVVLKHLNSGPPPGSDAISLEMISWLEMFPFIKQKMTSL